MKYKLSLTEGRLDCLKLAIVTESNYGTREIHEAEPACAESKEDNTKPCSFYVCIPDKDTITNSDKITLCALLPSGGITAQSHLFKSHMVNHHVSRDAPLFTCNYDQRIKTGVEECLQGKFNEDESRDAETLMLVNVRLCTPCAPTHTLEELQAEVIAYNKVAEEETNLMKRLDSDVKLEVDSRLEDASLPTVEVVLLRTPQLLQFVVDREHSKNETCNLIFIKPF